MGDIQMSNMDSMDREQKKKRLRQRMLSSPGGQNRGEGRGLEEEEIVRKEEAYTRKKRIRIFILIAVLLLTAAAVLYYSLYVRRYEDYRTAWEKQIPASENGFAGYEPFGSNVLKYTKDGASYIDSRGKIVWSISYQMKSPVCYVNGSYAVIADRQGNSLYI